MKENDNSITFKNKFKTKKKKFGEMKRNEPFVFDEPGESDIWIKIVKEDEILTTNKPVRGMMPDEMRKNIYNLTLGYLSYCEDNNKAVQTVKLDILII